MKRSVLSIFLILVMLLAMAMPAFGAEDITEEIIIEETAELVETPGETEPPAETEMPSETGEPAETDAPAETEEPAGAGEETPAPESADTPLPDPAEEPALTEESEASAETTPAPDPVPAAETVPEELTAEEPEAEEGELALETDGSYQDTEKAIVKRIITSGMSEFDKLLAITKYAADNYSYSSNYTSQDFVNYGSGNCIASTEFIMDLCSLCGIKAWARSAARDNGAASQHVCALALIDGEYYLADAGYSGSKPRSYDVFQIPGGFNVKDGTLFQYDGKYVEHLIVPEVCGDSYRVKKTRAYTVKGTAITKIGYDGQQCFSFGSGLKSVTLPKTVKTVTGTAFKGCDSLENIYVDPDNPYFTSIDGVLYSKDLTRLVCVPAKKTSLKMPKSVKTQDKDAFYGGSIPVTKVSGSLPFKDVSNQWFTSSVRFVYDRSLFKGTTSTTFSPNANMTRGMFITVLGRFACGASQSAAREKWTGVMGVTVGGDVAIRDKTSTTSGAVLARVVSAGESVTVLSKVSKGLDGALWYKVKYGKITGYIRAKSTGSKAKTLLKVYTGGFKDLPAGSYFTGHAQWANIQGIMNGVSSTAFQPEKNIKREDICVLLYRYLTEYQGKKLSASGKKFGDDKEISSYAKTAVYAMRSIGVVSGYPDGGFRPKANATRAEVAKMFENLYKYLNG